MMLFILKLNKIIFFIMEIQDNSDIYLRDYKLIERIGFGAHGIVFKSIKKEENKIYVIKQIPLFNKNINNIEEAKNEALILKKLNCKFIVKYYESFEENNTFNIVMEYCEKGDLSSLLFKLKKKNKYLKENQIWLFFIQICIGLSYIHYKKILHRDLKTQNIFLNKDLNIKIGDLGIAKILEGTNHANTLIGTPFYLSPEICEEKPYNEKSDVWALGCILYELITFKHPYNASNQAALLLKIVNGNYENINSNIKISNDLKSIIDLLLEKNYVKRPSMIELINNKIFIEKSKELGFYQIIMNINYLYKNKESQSLQNKHIIKINNNIRQNKKLNTYLGSQSLRNNNCKIRKKHINSVENINLSRKDHSINQNIFSCSNIRNEKKIRTSSIDYICSLFNGKKIPIKHGIKNKYSQNSHLKNISKIIGNNLSLKKISPREQSKNKKKNSTPFVKKITKCNSFRIKNNRVNSSNLNKYINQKPIFQKILDKFELNRKKRNLKLNISQINKEKMHYITTVNKKKEREKDKTKEKEKIKNESISARLYENKRDKEKISLKKQQKLYQKNDIYNEKSYNVINKENKNNININTNENVNITSLQLNKIENDSFEIIEPEIDKKNESDSLNHISDNEESYKFKITSEIKDESDSNKGFDEEKVFIINNSKNLKNNDKKEKLIIERYIQFKKEIYNYKNQIDCDKLLNIFNEIDKNLNANKMDEMIFKINNYIKLHLPKKIIPQFKKIFNKFCLYGLQLKYSKIEEQKLNDY